MTNQVGIFQCPVSGVYVFQVTIGNVLGTSAYEVRLEVAGTAVMNVYTGRGASGDSDHKCGSDQAIVHCNQGQLVLVKYANTDGRNSQAVGNYCSFSGFYLNA